MPEAFDPYHKWLGIPPHEQPPTHYRLLGVDRFETDPDVIESAADQRMSHLRSFQAGKRSKQSQRLLNEVAAAKACLLNPEKRAVYDADLAAKEIPSQSPTEVADVGFPSFTETLSPDTPSATARVRKSKRRSSQWLYLVGIGGGAVLVLVLGIALNGVLQTDAGRDRPGAPREKGPSTSVESLPTVAVRDSSPPEPAQPVPSAPQRETRPAVAQNPERPAAVPEVEPSTNSGTNLPAGAPESSSDGPRQPVPLPSEEEQREIWSRISQFLDVDAAKTTEEQQALLAKLTALAREQRASSIERYVLLRAAVRIAVKIPDAIATMDIANDISQQYVIEADLVKIGLLGHVAGNVRTADDFEHLRRAGRTVLDDLEERNEYEKALVLVQKLYSGTLGSAAGREYRVELNALQKKLESAQRQLSRFETAIQTLARNPGDSAANHEAGIWYCLWRQDWERGLPHLAKSSDGQFAGLAGMELAAHADSGNLITPSNKLELAELWWQAASKHSSYREPMMLRAGLWYSRALPGIDSPVIQTEVRSRLATISKIGPIRDPELETLDYDRSKKVLIIMQDGRERGRAQQALQRLGMLFDVARFNLNQADYSPYHTILVGSNDMDYWVGERKRPEAFQHIDRFVDEGGHLFVFGTFNCRNLEHLFKYGIKVGFQHTDVFARSGRASELFLADVEALVPEDFRTRSFGNFWVTQPHTVLLQRGANAPAPVAATIPHERGRITYSTVEPSATNGLWLIDAAVTWVERGSPVPTDTKSNRD